jgi:hypothetical protein
MLYTDKNSTCGFEWGSIPAVGWKKAPQLIGNKPAARWKLIRSPLEAHSAVDWQHLRSRLEMSPQSAGNKHLPTSL